MSGSEALGADSAGAKPDLSALPEPGAGSTVGLLSVAAGSPRSLRSVTAPADGALGAGQVTLREISLPNTGGLLGIPEIVLAAYRNAELALESSMPGCGLRWHLLAGIGRIESAHADNGRTDAAGTAVSPILGPALDGTLPGNEIIAAAGGGYVRALGPMQFLPSTWSQYAADGNGDGVSDPQNVFDSALAAGKYLCSGGMNLADPQQEVRAVLRYNNSSSYAADVLSWSAAYRSGGAPRPVTVAPGLVPPSTVTSPSRPGGSGVDVLASAPGARPLRLQPMAPTAVPDPSPPVLVNLPGIGAVSCGLLCDTPGTPHAPKALPAPVPASPKSPPAPRAGAPLQAAPAAPSGGGAQLQPAPAAPAPAPSGPSIELPLGISIPLPAPPT
ncbi:lytic transglycosylase domain-containing protein [Nocardia higoensis]|uniref:lytic transglycosylase domain-containing protein n=1 Tax=Nocardia higoensis TaxID=228599 RepID=UPI001FE06FC0|nr:lytic murein transglycosylase [Nocardia higoensis]